MKKIVDDNNRSSFWMGFQIFIVAQSSIFVALPPSLERNLPERSGSVLPDLGQLGIQRLRESWMMQSAKCHVVKLYAGSIPVLVPIVPCAARSIKLLMLFIHEKTGLYPTSAAAAQIVALSPRAS